MKSLLLLAVAALSAPAFMACSNRAESEEQVQENSIKADEQVMDDLGDKGSAALAEPGTATVDANGDTVVTVVDMQNIQ